MTNRFSDRYEVLKQAFWNVSNEEIKAGFWKLFYEKRGCNILHSWLTEAHSAITDRTPTVSASDASIYILEVLIVLCEQGCCPSPIKSDPIYDIVLSLMRIGVLDLRSVANRCICAWNKL